MENLIVRQFSEERMAPIIDEFKTKEYASGITKRQVITDRNLLYLANFRQQYVTFDVEGMERMSFYDEESWVAQEVEAYLYFEILKYQEEIIVEKLKEQIFYRIIKQKLHIGIKPGAKYEVILVKENEVFDCLIKAKFYSNIFCPDFNYFAWQLDKVTEIIQDALTNPNMELTYEDVENFLSDGESRNFYNDKDEDENEDYYEDEQDDFEREYRSRSMEEEGYDDYDYFYGGDYDEPDFDEDYYVEQSEEKYNKKIDAFFDYATVLSDMDEAENPPKE